MSKLLKLALVLFLSAPLWAQNTTVTGTVVDQNGNPYSNGNVSAQTVPPSGQQVITYTPVTTNSMGSFSETLPSNVTYIFTACGTPVNLGPLVPTPKPLSICFNSAPIVITGATEDISAQMLAASKLLGPVPPSHGSGCLPGGSLGEPLVNGGSSTCPGTIIYLDASQFGGSDMGAQINAAFSAAQCSGANSCTVRIPAGVFSFSTTIQLPSYGVLIGGGGPTGPTELDWTPTSGNAVSMPNVTGVKIEGVQFRNNVAASTSVCINIGPGTQDVTLRDAGCGQPNDTLGFATNILSGGSDTSPVGDLVIENFNSRAFTSVGMDFHHTVDVNGSIAKNYAVLGSPCNPTGAIGVIFDTGVSGVQFHDLENGCSGIVYQNSMPTTNRYGFPPQFIRLDLETDDESPQNGMLFAASLDTPSGPSNNFIGYDFRCVNCWHSAATLAGVDVKGGTNIFDDDSIIRANRQEGVKIEGLTQSPCSGLGYSGPCGGHTSFTHELMNDNGGSSGYADVHILAGVSYFNVSDNTLYGTGGGDNGAGTDEGIKIESGASDHCEMHHNQIYTQRVLPVINLATGNQCRDDDTVTDSSIPRPDFSYPAPAMGFRWGQYQSGGTISGTTGQTCTLGSFNGGGSGATATVALTSTNTIAAGTQIVMTATGSGYYFNPTTATLGSGTATCSGTATITSELGGASSSTTRNTVYFGDQANLFGYDSAGNPAWIPGQCPAGASGLNYQSASNSGLGQWNFSLCGSQVLNIRPAGSKSSFTQGLSVSNGFQQAGQGTGCAQYDSSGNLTSTGTNCGITSTVCSGTITLNPGSLSNQCSTAATLSCTGLTASDTIIWTPNGDLSGATGYGTAAMSPIEVYPTTNTVNMKYCTSGSVTPGSTTWNIRVVR